MRYQSAQPARVWFIRIIVSLALYMPGNASAAGIATDGSLGAVTTLSGPSYTISATLGQTRGGNLFHSFSQFNLSAGERATFSGPATISSIISRVTGGSSSIDGTIASSINGANIYLLNPAGIVFGPNATLDVSGSFHATTADYLKLGTTGRFEAAINGFTNLTTDPPGAFGFLSSSPAPLAVNGSSLNVPAGKNISLTGGGIDISNGNLRSNGGAILLTSIASDGEVLYGSSGTALQGFSSLGPLSITENRPSSQQPVYSGAGIPVEMPGRRVANLDASSAGGGKIIIRGGSFYLSGGTIYNDTYGDTPAKSVDIIINGTTTLDRSSITANAVSGSASGAAITISGGNVRISDSVVNTDSQSGAPGSGITLSATDDLVMSGGAIISTDATSAGSRAGNAAISAPEITISNGSRVSSSAPVLGAAGAGSITITAPRSLTVGGELRSDTFDGTSGAITIKTATLNVSGNGLISSALVANPATTPRTAGDIAISADNVTLSGDGRIQSNVLFSNSGSAGNVVIDAARVSLLERSSISASIDSVNGTGGTITVTGKEDILVASNPAGQVKEYGSIASNTTAGDAGHITLHAKNISVINGGSVSTFGQPGSSGSAGNIALSATSRLSIVSGAVNTQSASANGGNITVAAPGAMQILRGDVTASATAGIGNGGNVTIDAGYLTLNDGRITARAEYGAGGNLLLKLDNMFIKSSGSLLSASSRYGAQGTVVVEAPNTDVAGALAVPAFDILNLNSFIPKRCLVPGEQNASSFRLLGGEGLPAAPELSFPSILRR